MHTARPLAILSACTGAMLTTVGIGLCLRGVDMPAVLLAVAGVLLVRAGVVEWGRG